MTRKLFAAYYESTGIAGEVLRFGELDIPAIGSDDVLVDVHATGINPADVKRLKGSAPTPAQMKSGSGPGAASERRLFVPGDDGAGVIVDVGSNVSRQRIGERVWLRNARVDRDFGTAASRVVIPSAQALALPDGISFEAGACIGVPALTAHYALFVDGDIRGQTLLIHGGAGGVGSTAVQLAKWGGAQVIATVSSEEKAKVARQCGADHVVNYKTENVVEVVMRLTNGAGVDRVVDVAFGVNLATNLDVVKTNGVIATYSSDANDAPTLPFWRLLRKNLRVHFLVIYWLPEAYLRAAFRDITAALGGRALKPVISHVLPLQDLAAAHGIVDKLSGVGNVVLIPPR